MSSRSLMGRAIVGGVATVGFGWMVMRVTTPSDKQFYDSLSPQLKREVDSNRQAADRRAAYESQLAKAREQEEEPLLPSSK